MGRLIRKKSASKKKKAVNVGQAAAAASENAVAGAVAEKGREAPKKPAPSPRKPSAAPKPPAAVREKNFIDKSLQFLREVKVELKKVTWPTRKQAIGSTVVVIVLVFAISLFLGAVDIGLSSLIRVILR